MTSSSDAVLRRWLAMTGADDQKKKAAGEDPPRRLNTRELEAQ
jgi:hypothetical protein